MAVDPYAQTSNSQIIFVTEAGSLHKFDPYTHPSVDPASATPKNPHAQAAYLPDGSRALLIDIGNGPLICVFSAADIREQTGKTAYLKPASKRHAEAIEFLGRQYGVACADMSPLIGLTLRDEPRPPKPKQEVSCEETEEEDDEYLEEGAGFSVDTPLHHCEMHDDPCCLELSNLLRAVVRQHDMAHHGFIMRYCHDAVCRRADRAINGAVRSSYRLPEEEASTS